MALTKELLHVLDDEREPLPKRLKIADNAFKTSKLQIQNREVLLFNWIGNIAKTNDHPAWSLFLSWLTSPQTQELSRNDVTVNDIRNLLNVITEGVMLATQNNKNIIINCAVSVIENNAFHQLFKHDVCNYCMFVSKILSQINDGTTLSKFILNEQLFNRHLVATEDFPKYFIKNILITIGGILEKFPARKDLFLDLSVVVQKCLFHRNFKIFSSYFRMLYENEKSDENTSKLPKLLIKYLIEILNDTSSISIHIYKSVFYAFCASYNNSFDLVYKFFILLVETLGFDMSTYFNIKKIRKFNNTSCSIEKSVAVLSELCEVITCFSKELNYKVNEISFTELIKNMTLSVISLTKEPNGVVYKFLDCIIVIDPLITEQILNDLLVYVMLSNKEATKIEYEKFFIAVFEVFIKLHRIPNLIAKMTPALKSALEDNFQRTSSSILFCGVNDEHAPNYTFSDMMPDKVLNYFHQCITTFASWQVINLFKTLLFHFQIAVSELSAAPEEGSKIVYVEFISALIGQFLCSVRIAEHTATTGAVEKFVKNMEDLRDMLKTFGTTLVKMEHNPSLMRSYLNICYPWGELYVTLAYYSIDNEIILLKTLDTDSAACNITYIHSYLTRDQWRLVSQRITNFGEKPCKLIMNKLYMQKLKAMMLFEASVSEEVLTAIKAGILSTIDDNWRDLINDQVVLSQIVSNTTCKSIAELLLSDISKNKNFDQLSSVFDNYDLVSMILYTCISKIYKSFKRQCKNSQIDVKNLLISKMYLHINEDLFFNAKDSSLSTLRDVFTSEISKMSHATESNCNMNDTELSCFIEVIRCIPIIQYDSSTIQELLILFLISVLLELRRNSVVHVDLINRCESIIIGIVQNCSGSLNVLIEPFTTLRLIIENFHRYNDLYDHIIHNIFKFEAYRSLKGGIDVVTKLVKDEKYLQCIMLILKYINKYRKSKISVENKEQLLEYQETIFKGLWQFIQKDKKEPDLTEAYALILKHRLAKQNDGEVAELLPFLDKYIDGICKNKKDTRGSLLLFTTILRNKAKIKTISDDISLRAWNYCQQLKDKNTEEFSGLIVLIIEHIPNEQFLDIVNNLLSVTNVLNEKNYSKFVDELSICNIILTSNLNPIKTRHWQNYLELILLQHVLPHLSSGNQSDQECLYESIVKFEINIIQRAQLPITPLLIDAIFLTISIMTANQTHQFLNTFVPSIMLLQMLLKFRKSQMMDYLPVYLQRYRTLLNMLCIKSNADLSLESGEAQQISDCAHKLEKLTNNLVSCNKHMMRIAPYLVADILKHYEEITLLPNVKLHLNNCLYSLISLCDEHAVSYLMRILSSASTEMFKVIYENYKKYYKFTGRV